MLSYRHAFHAGNFADVHKHVAWVFGIQSLLRKPSPFCLLDAYAGAGLYDLDDAAARRTGEWEQGIGRVLAETAAPEVFVEYLQLVRRFNDGIEPPRYPGSPALAAALLRAGDRLVCLELHPSDYPLLKKRFAGDPRIHVHRRDAREGLSALVPPTEKRGLVLVDPPYERSAEYEEVPAMVERSCRRWPTGSFLLWYPLLSGNPHEPMVRKLEGFARKLLVQELLLRPEAPGLRGSGLAWINPPWQADDFLERAGEWMRAHLGEPGAGLCTEWRVPE